MGRSREYARRKPDDDEPDSGDVAAGRVLYQQRCRVPRREGKGRTEAGAGLYPPALDLRYGRAGRSAAFAQRGA
jgi:hypothetical protein